MYFIGTETETKTKTSILLALKLKLLLVSVGNAVFNTVSLDLTAGMTDTFEGMGAYSFEGGGGLLEDLR